MPPSDPKSGGREPTSSGSKRPPEEITGSGMKKPIDEGTASGRRALDKYEGTTAKSDPKAKPLTETAPEIARAFKERAFIARGVMAKDDVVSALQHGLTECPPEGDLVELWMPFLRQAVEQAGGDGVDVAIASLLKPPGKSANVPLVQQLRAAFQGLHRSHGDARTEAARQIIEAIRGALEAPTPPRISMKGLQKDLEGRVELDTLLWVLFASDDALVAREAQVAVSLESLRAQLKQMPGKQPEGMLWNFGRLKAERDLLLAERKRR
jgi:hypothetical protein